MASSAMALPGTGRVRHKWSGYAGSVWKLEFGAAYVLWCNDGLEAKKRQYEPHCLVVRGYDYHSSVVWVQLS